MMASGMNGQSFTFHGYLPIEKGRKSSPKKSRENFAGKNQSQIFIENPTETIKCWKISYRLYILKPICVLLLILLYRIYQNEESICLEKKTSICTIDPPFYHP
jgi:16S rRNA (cytidine1402-2'-O)-methyltransferase